MRGSLFGAVMLCALVSGVASASTQALIEKSYCARYTGPVQVAEVAGPKAPADPEKPTVVDRLAAWYADEIRKDTAALAQQLSRTKPSTYESFLAQRKARAFSCVDTLPEALLPKVKAFLSASETAEQDTAVHELRKAISEQPREVLDCLDAVLVKLDRRGAILVSGLTWGKTSEGAEQLKPTLHNPGRVYILRPQVLTAWPGRPDSALRVLDPRLGPWKVRLAHTYEPKVEAHSQQWKQRPTISVQKYLQQTNNGHFLLVDDEDVPLGWLDMDQAAFFHERWAEDAADSRFIYTSGAAAYVHGVWWNPEGRTPDSYPAMEEDNLQEPIYVLDFLRLIQGETRSTSESLHSPYPRFLQLRGLRSMYRGDDPVPESLSYRLNLLAVRRNTPNDIWRLHEEAGAISTHKDHLEYRIGSASIKTTLQGIYKTP